MQGHEHTVDGAVEPCLGVGRRHYHDTLIVLSGRTSHCRAPLPPLIRAPRRDVHTLTERAESLNGMVRPRL